MRSALFLIVAFAGMLQVGEAFQTGGLRPNLMLRQTQSAQCRHRSKPFTVVALAAPPPPPPPPAQASGSKTLTKSEQADLNLQLWEAAKNGETDAVVKLHAAGAQVNFYDPELLQSTALHWSATNGHVDTTAKLIELGASVFPTNQHGWTALHHAANWGYSEVARVLIKNGADAKAKSESGKTPLDAALFKGYSNVVEVFREMLPDDFTSFFEEEEVKRKPIEGFTPDLSPTNSKRETVYTEWKESWGQQF
ncbi:hypothetical protein GUITHDRAFT_166938 [Guillardia theta CCMP2712]|uniref:Uncharacterized protein n=1 Tax=Guillardia theta (strain CCMP2712) TaxID=905079 RepID=L1I5K3_GUITC|nr:hypothetical protein GUITHDRAFT_166938 [Guillardia theta CCMP2712]EKX31164.1 hypothetical protein GUITHDRAFT_166938 [Guillardia theta CCMP2712]|mmetsp:Transcript_115/g.257  ORF Transcript_115/g.257 Transcript_115/m.257 type:complete len:251 (-) Transcript_115:91-843(-)|eukprot:XP_005818144.1 hypothetical protein GUITHDRAFT_166938 [Guillardia theta CCMP2712]